MGAKELTLNLQGFAENLKFAMVDPASLKIDHSYQRDETDLVDHIARHFNPLAFGCGLVGERSDGNRYLVDAQQRTRGAQKAGVPLVPVMIFKSEGRAQEAELFRYLNQFRKPVTQIDIFRASLVEGEPDSTALNKAVEAANFKIALRKGMSNKWPYITAIEQLWFIFRGLGAGAVTDVLGLIDTYWKNDVDALRREAIRGIYEFYRAFGKTLDPDRMKTRFKGNPMDSVINQATSYKAKEKSRGHTMHLYQAVFATLRQLYGKSVPEVDKAWPRETVS